MPVRIDIMENRVLGREYKRGFREGYEKGWQKAQQEDIIAFVRKQIEKRFGRILERADRRLQASSVPEVEGLGLRVLDATSLDELFP